MIKYNVSVSLNDSNEELEKELKEIIEDGSSFPCRFKSIKGYVNHKYIGDSYYEVTFEDYLTEDEEFNLEQLLIDIVSGTITDHDNVCIDIVDCE